MDQKVSEPSPIPRLVPCLRSFEEQVEWRINESSKKAQVSWLPPCSIRVSALALILISASTTSNGGRAFGISLVVVIGWKASGCVVLPVHPSFLKQLEKREGTKREGFVKKAGTPRPPLGTERRPLRGGVGVALSGKKALTRSLPIRRRDFTQPTSSASSVIRLALWPVCRSAPISRNR